MLRTAVSLLCAVAVFAPAAAFANDRDYYRGLSRPNDNRYRHPDQERAIDFYNRDRRDDREWNRRDEARERYWRDRRDDRFRRDYRRDRSEERRVIIIPHFSF